MSLQLHPALTVVRSSMVWSLPCPRWKHSPSSQLCCISVIQIIEMGIPYKTKKGCCRVKLLMRNKGWTGSRSHVVDDSIDTKKEQIRPGAAGSREQSPLPRFCVEATGRQQLMWALETRPSLPQPVVRGPWSWTIQRRSNRPRRSIDLATPRRPHSRTKHSVQTDRI